MTNDIFGVIDSTGTHIDVSKTERGAKNYATRNGYNNVSIRVNAGYVAYKIFEKVEGKWRKVKYNKN